MNGLGLLVKGSLPTLCDHHHRLFVSIVCLSLWDTEHIYGHTIGTLPITTHTTHALSLFYSLLFCCNQIDHIKIIYIKNILSFLRNSLLFLS